MPSIHAAAAEVLRATSLTDKVALVRRLRTIEVAPGAGDDGPVLPPSARGRPARPELVPPRRLRPRGVGTEAGRVAAIHAVAHIEANAIDLAVDAVHRFRGLPAAFYEDWVRVADEEATHFELLSDRLTALGAGYGDLPAHGGLWDSAAATADDPLRRMALVPRVLEARGLDVNPSMIARFAAVGDEATVAVLRVILRDEVGHVAVGDRWFRWLCARRGLDAEATFAALLAEEGVVVRPPLNVEARLAAGFTEAELARLAGGG